MKQLKNQKWKQEKYEKANPKIDESEILSRAKIEFGFQFVAIKNNDERPERSENTASVAFLEIYDA